MNNPFSIAFGKAPESFITRYMQEHEIIDCFLEDNPEQHLFMLTGVRGAGKTVALSTISDEMKQYEDWIVVDLNPERDLLQALAAELSNRKDLLQIFTDAKLNLSVLGLGIEIDGQPPITDVVVALDRMLERITKKGKKVLVTIDEVSSSQYVKEFASQFQIFIRKKYNIFLLMTGLYENIYELQNEKTMTFLYRAPKVELKPLNRGMMAHQYQQALLVSQEEAAEMAKMTKGYPFAFQVLGYLCFKGKKPWTDVMGEFDTFMEEYVYEKIWSELSGKDRMVVTAICESATGKVEEIRKIGNLSSNEFTVYRKRLLKKGLVQSTEYGFLELTLPRFDVFVQGMMG